jgi:hypothetical protein
MHMRNLILSHQRRKPDLVRSKVEDGVDCAKEGVSQDPSSDSDVDADERRDAGGGSEATKVEVWNTGVSVRVSQDRRRETYSHWGRQTGATTTRKQSWRSLC